MGHPSPLTDETGAGFNAGHMKGYTGYRLAEFTYPILPSHQGGAMWFYSLPEYDSLCFPAEKLYADYLGAVKFGNIFALDVGPDYSGRLREIDVQTLRKVGQYIRGEIKLPPPPISQGKLAHASSIWKGNSGFEASAAVDGDSSTRWGAVENSRSGWLEVDLGEPTGVNRAVIDEGNWDRVRQFSLQAKIGEKWQTVAEGTTLGLNKELLFEPINAQVWRLTITEATDVPTIWEFQLFQPKK